MLYNLILRTKTTAHHVINLTNIGFYYNIIYIDRTSANIYIYNRETRTLGGLRC
jgi:hypothetical protein